MALITKENIEKIDKERNSVHGKVRASYTSFQSGGKTFFQIDTYSSTIREQKDKISQSIQLDSESAKELIKILAAAFNIDISSV